MNEKNNKERLWLEDQIASAELKLAEMDFQEIAEQAEPFIVSGQLIPEDMRFQIQDAYMKLQTARDKFTKARNGFRN